jgi:hypothetical protein
MGRPIKSKFFGNRASPYDNAQTGGVTGVGGEGVATVVVSNSGTLYTTSTTLTATFSAPQIKGGVRATGTATTDAAGLVSGFTLTLAGTGYTSAPTVTLPATTGTTATFTVTLTAAVQNALAFTSYLTTGSNAVTGGDIIKQESSLRYLVQNSEGRGQVRLVATDTLAAGQMNIIATDGSGATYFVKKLTAKKAYLVNRTSTSTSVVSSLVAQWTVTGSTGNTLITAATGTNQVSIASN